MAGIAYLEDTLLLRKPLRPEHVNNRLLDQRGASLGLSFMHVHLNRYSGTRPLSG